MLFILSSKGTKHLGEKERKSKMLSPKENLGVWKSSTYLLGT